jgi:hypothetical protein
MNYRYWLNLMGFISLVMLTGLFIKSINRAKDIIVSQGDFELSTKPNPFLFNTKMNLIDATVADFVSIDGISLATARHLVTYISSHPDASLEDLDNAPHIGPKMLVKLRAYFKVGRSPQTTPPPYRRDKVLGLFSGHD